MKKYLLSLLIMLTATASFAQQADEKAIKQTITEFAQAGDAQDADKLATYLDANYRVVMNQLFGSTEVAVMPREAYLQKIRAKEFGGDSRQLTFQHIEINGNTACARVTMAGKKATFKSLLVLVKDKNNKWLIVSDVPTM